MTASADNFELAESRSVDAPKNGLRALLWAVAGVALALIFHNYCLSILPRMAQPLDPRRIQPVQGTHAFQMSLPHTPGDTEQNPRSRVMLTENDVPFGPKHRLPQYVFTNGMGSWCHSPGALIFSTPDNSDPRTNGRRYVVYVPILYSRAVGYGAIVALVIACWGLRRQRSSAAPIPSEREEKSRRQFTLHLVGGAVLFLATLYLSTGTLSPYANTLIATVEKSTGYLYNIDHLEHRTLFAFVAGEPRENWEHSILLRRILYPVLAEPSMRHFGYELGGVLFNLLANLLGYFAGVAMIQRHVGGRGALLAVWLLAMYPGAAYWVGQPYGYALIFPLSIAAFWILLELPSARPSRVVVLSLALGVIYLGYDLLPFFLPASLLLLVWKRRPAIGALTVVLQVLPLVSWLWILKHVVGVPLENSNSGLYRTSIAAFFDVNALGTMGGRITALPEIAADVFFGANFLFVPLLVVAAWAMDFSWHSFMRHRAAVVLLMVGISLFLFFNLLPPHAGAWNLSGSWIARLYQPLFPALVLWLAQWWQDTLPQNHGARRVRLALVALTLAGNGLIAFGPALDNPLRISERTFYHFYDHTDAHWAYPHNLQHYGRRPLGFPRAFAQ